MTVDNHTKPCADIFGLLQPFVDNELTDGERTVVVEHLENCSDCLAQIQMQQRVRAALKQLALEPAPASLRSTILAELDRIDASSNLALKSDPRQLAGANLWQQWKQRMQAFMRGGLVMLPASVAAVGLFFVIQYSFEADPNRSSPNFVGSLTDIPIPSPSGSSGSSLTKPSLPPDVELISTSAKGNSYRHHGLGLQVMDLHQPPQFENDRGELRRIGNRSYRLSRDERGWPVIQFKHNKVLHTLVFENAPVRTVGRQKKVVTPDFRSLLDLADALANDSAPLAPK